MRVPFWILVTVPAGVQGSRGSEAGNDHDEGSSECGVLHEIGITIHRNSVDAIGIWFSFPFLFSSFFDTFMARIRYMNEVEGEEGGQGYKAVEQTLLIL